MKIQQAVETHSSVSMIGVAISPCCPCHPVAAALVMDDGNDPHHSATRRFNIPHDFEQIGQQVLLEDHMPFLQGYSSWY